MANAVHLFRISNHDCQTNQIKNTQTKTAKTFPPQLVRLRMFNQNEKKNNTNSWTEPKVSHWTAIFLAVVSSLPAWKMWKTSERPDSRKATALPIHSHRSSFPFLGCWLALCLLKQSVFSFRNSVCLCLYNSLGRDTAALVVHNIICLAKSSYDFVHTQWSNCVFRYRFRFVCSLVIKYPDYEQFFSVQLNRMPPGNTYLWIEK